MIAVLAIVFIGAIAMSVCVQSKPFNRRNPK